MDGLTKVQNTVHRYGYIVPPERTDRYWFTLQFDFDQNGTDGLEIRFDGPPAQLDRKDLAKVWYSADPDTARLSLMAQIDYIRECLEGQGIPLTFEPGERLMSPPLFRNIYMGALGETVGCRMIEHLTDGMIVPEEMPPEQYEKFDFYIGNGVYVDFKDWNESNYGDEKKTERTLKMITDKLNACGGSRVYVVNIVTDGSRRYEPYHIYDAGNGREIVTVPYLYEVRNGKVSPNGAFVRKLTEEEA